MTFASCIMSMVQKPERDKHSHFLTVSLMKPIFAALSQFYVLKRCCMWPKVITFIMNFSSVHNKTWTLSLYLVIHACNIQNNVATYNWPLHNNCFCCIMWFPQISCLHPLPPATVLKPNLQNCYILETAESVYICYCSCWK